MIAKLRRSGKYSVRLEKTNREKDTVCDRCTNARKPHTPETCYFLDKTCRVCQKVGYMGGSKRCKHKKSIHKVEIVSRDYEDSSNWHHASGEVLKGEKAEPQKISIKKVGKKRNTVKVKVGGIDTDMFADSGADVSIVPAHWYESGMGKLQVTDDVLNGYAGKEPIPVTAKFRTTITTSRGASIECWVYIVEGDHNLQPLLGDPESQALGFITFHPEGREPTAEEKNNDSGISESENININGISANVKIGAGPMPDAVSEPEITEKEREECWEVVNRPKYASIFDGHIGTMVKRKPIVFHGDETKRIHSQPYRPVPPQYEEEVSKHLQYLRDNNKIVDVDPNTERVEAYSNLVI